MEDQKKPTTKVPSAPLKREAGEMVNYQDNSQFTALINKQNDSGKETNKSKE